eukprot:TRINITY_DN2258_c0_g1_i1.p1 TRINITY_DN2258_c0_g1~~TRINITY_DN2258_c0_g1_i1.p1  ORF type:complete len:167 (-),score=35.97 TRINITY_DN2258_c0_g1_i1:152-652(-)
MEAEEVDGEMEKLNFSRKPGKSSALIYWQQQILVCVEEQGAMPKSEAEQNENLNAENDDLGEIKVDSAAIKNLQENKDELLGRIQGLKKDLTDWRGRLDEQVKSYREELGTLRKSLNDEVENLRSEFQDLRVTLKTQLELTASMAAREAPKHMLEQRGSGQQVIQD